jgi:hypothetical protein
VDTIERNPSQKRKSIIKRDGRAVRRIVEHRNEQPQQSKDEGRDEEERIDCPCSP